ncbi:uncharacterized protein V2V93DRAFT_370668 [Kockiozyma suomiensis]|uniref:uncharacterized protein n=1 Tax=Kockiozyma suomiensis TaxID=1337062 RepID=UPI003342F4DA
MTSLWRALVGPAKSEPGPLNDAANQTTEDEVLENRRGDEDVQDDQTPPPFPSLDSAQRASTVDSTTVQISNEQPQQQQQSLAPPSSAMGPPSISPGSGTTSSSAAAAVRRHLPPPTATSLDRLNLKSTSGSRPLPVFNFANVSGGTASSRGRAVPQSSSSLTTPNTAAISLSQARRKREKVSLEPGFSQLDWASLKNSGKDLSGRPPGVPPVRITVEELKKHSTLEDAWTALGGKVYNLTPYLRFHPGGVREAMRCAGKDGTHLFNITHMWVNYDRMLGNCFIGYLVPSGSS